MVKKNILLIKQLKHHSMELNVAKLITITLKETVTTYEKA